MSKPTVGSVVLSASPAPTNEQIKTLVHAAVRRLICECSEVELLAYRLQVRKECGYTEEKVTVQ
jgi:hypothetical protein